MIERTTVEVTTMEFIDIGATAIHVTAMEAITMQVIGIAVTAIDKLKKKGKDIGDSDGLHRENSKCYESRRDRGNGEGIHRDSVIANRQ